MSEGVSITVAATLDDAVRAVQAGAMPAAGMTIIRLMWAEGRNTGTPIVDLSRLTDLAHIAPWEGGVRIGALTDLETIRSSPLVRARLPQLSTLLDEVAALGVRHLATLGGNIAWSGGDLAPLLMTLDAIVETDTGDHSLEALPAPALILAVRIPRPPAIAFAEKVGYRAAFSPSLVTVAFAALIADGRLTGVRAAIGGGSTRSQRLLAVEQHLDGQPLDSLDAVAIGALVSETAACVSDDFATGEHRRTVAGRIIAHRLLEACRGAR